MGTSWEEGPIEEVYTDEHEKLLGTCETSWTLFVDGYSKDGGRIYDQVIGKTCHQCRQKTLGHRTNCSKCNLVQGQFCGDCLYMRYGENVLEANKTPNWICPVCRGICNCSICRTKKGWAPTGILYKKILRLGFKSVAHFLIQTKRAQNTEGRSAHQISAKRSLPFTDEVGPLQITNGDNNDDHYNQQMILFDDSKDKETECSGDADMQTFGECGSISTLETSKTSRKRQKKSTLIVRPSMDSIAGRLKNRRQLFRHSANNHQNDHCNGQIIALDLDNNFWLCRDEGKDSKCIGNEEVQNSDKCDDSPSLERAGTTGNKHKEEMQSTLSGKPSPNSIAGRLRYCGTGYAHDSNGEKKTQSPDEYLRSITLENSQRVDKSSKENNLDLVTVPSLDGITGKQRTHTNKDSGCKHKKSNMTLSNRKPGNKHSNGKDLAPLVQPRIDCIAGRLRSRGFNRGGNDWSVDKGTQKTVMSNNAITLDSNGKPWNRKELTLIVTPTSVSIAERLRSRNKKGEIDITLESNRKVGKKPNEGTTLALTVKSDMDCIAGRLRRRGGAYP